MAGSGLLWAPPPVSGLHKPRMEEGGVGSRTAATTLAFHNAIHGTQTVPMLLFIATRTIQEKMTSGTQEFNLCTLLTESKCQHPNRSIFAVQPPNHAGRTNI